MPKIIFLLILTPLLLINFTGAAPAPIELSIEKTVDNSYPISGENIVFSVVVSNSGSLDARRVVVSDKLPSGLSFVSSSTSAGSYNQNNGIWQVGNLLVGDSKRLEITAAVVSGFEGLTITNTATANPGNNSDSVDIISRLILVANDDLYEIEEDEIINLSAPGFLKNDVGFISDITSVSLINDVDNGSLAFGEDGSFVYIPGENFNGSDYFEYQICNIFTDQCSSAIANISINPANNPPVAENDYYLFQLNSPVDILVIENDFDVDGNLDINSLRVISPPANGSAYVSLPGTINYTPNNMFSGVDYFEYVICDSEGLCDNAQVSVRLETGFVPPTPTPTPTTGCGLLCQKGELPISTIFEISKREKIETNEDEEIVFSPLLNLIDNYSFSIENIISDPKHGTVEITSENLIKYIPNKNFFGQDNIEYKLCLQKYESFCDFVNMLIIVNSIPDQPVARNDSFVGFFGETIKVSPLLNDYDLDSDLDFESLEIISSPNNGYIKNIGKVVFSYLPKEGFLGFDEFKYRICDQSGLCSEANILISILPEGDLKKKKIIRQIAFFAVEGEEFIFDPKNFFPDDEDFFLDSILNGPTLGKAEINDLNYISYIPELGSAHSKDSLNYKICSKSFNNFCFEITANFCISKDNITNQKIQFESCSLLFNKLSYSLYSDDPKLSFLGIKIYPEAYAETLNMPGGIRVVKFIKSFDGKKIDGPKFISIFLPCGKIKVELIEKGEEDYFLNKFGLEIYYREKLKYDKKLCFDLSKDEIGKKCEINILEISDICLQENKFCAPYLKQYLSFFTDNDFIEVKKLQKFFKIVEGKDNLKETGVYDAPTLGEVNLFQKKYWLDILAPWGLSDPTGYVFKTTSKKINDLYCDFLGNDNNLGTEFDNQ